MTFFVKNYNWLSYKELMETYKKPSILVWVSTDPYIV